MLLEQFMQAIYVFLTSFDPARSEFTVTSFSKNIFFFYFPLEIILFICSISSSLFENGTHPTILPEEGDYYLLQGRAKKLPNNQIGLYGASSCWPKTKRKLAIAGSSVLKNGCIIKNYVIYDHKKHGSMMKLKVKDTDLSGEYTAEGANVEDIRLCIAAPSTKKKEK